MGWLDPFEGFHAMNLLLGALLLLLIYRVVEARRSTVAAFMAVTLLFLSPRVVAHMMANIKDFPEMVLFSGSLLVGFVALERESSWGILAAGAVWGLALATKANALFAPIVVLAWLAWSGVSGRWKGRTRRLALFLAGAVVAGAIVAYALWPYLWADPVGRVSAHLRYITTRKLQTADAATANPFAMIMLTTPPLFLALSSIGIARAATRRDRFDRFTLAWVAVVAARLVIPGSVNFDGVRHFLEIFPALAILGGIGAETIADMARFRHPFAKAGLVGLVLAAQFATTLRAHPFELAYWNSIAGGYSGARGAGLPQASDYWATSYRRGLEWINRNAPARSVLVVPVAEHIVGLTGQEWLRRDVELFPSQHPRWLTSSRLDAILSLAGKRSVYVMYVSREDWRNETMDFCEQTLRPVAEWTLDGAPVLEIYRVPSRDQRAR